MQPTPENLPAINQHIGIRVSQGLLESGEAGHLLRASDGKPFWEGELVVYTVTDTTLDFVSASASDGGTFRLLWDQIESWEPWPTPREASTMIDSILHGATVSHIPSTTAQSNLQDSGQRLTLETGGQRERAFGKGRYDLLSPIALRRLATHMENGTVKYEARNWEKGLPCSWYHDAAVRHLYDWMDLNERDKEDHLAAALWNIHCLIHTQEQILRGALPQSLWDLPFPITVDDQ